MTDETDSSGGVDGPDADRRTDDDSEDQADPELRDAVDEFLERTDAALADYEKGYVDADATLRVVESHLRDLRTAAGE